MKAIKPNTILPKGGKLLKPPRKHRAGNWVEMVFDAEVQCADARWLRVKDGMGESGDREDWVADIPHVSASVHNYQFRPPYWGCVKYKSFEAACKGQLLKACQSARIKLKRLQEEVSLMEKTLQKLPQ